MRAMIILGAQGDLLKIILMRRRMLPVHDSCDGRGHRCMMTMVMMTIMILMKRMMMKRTKRMMRILPMHDSCDGSEPQVHEAPGNPFSRLSSNPPLCSNMGTRNPGRKVFGNF